jgi:hypothetical protein
LNVYCFDENKNQFYATILTLCVWLFTGMFEEVEVAERCVWGNDHENVAFVCEETGRCKLGLKDLEGALVSFKEMHRISMAMGETCTEKAREAMRMVLLIEKNIANGTYIDVVFRTRAQMGE